jgi:hypothetical protein
MTPWCRRRYDASKIDDEINRLRKQKDDALNVSEPAFEDAEMKTIRLFLYAKTNTVLAARIEQLMIQKQQILNGV